MPGMSTIILHEWKWSSGGIRPLFTPQIRHGLPWERTQASVVTSQVTVRNIQYFDTVNTPRNPPYRKQRAVWCVCWQSSRAKQVPSTTAQRRLQFACTFSPRRVDLILHSLLVGIRHHENNGVQWKVEHAGLTDDIGLQRRSSNFHWNKLVLTSLYQLKGLFTDGRKERMWDLRCSWRSQLWLCPLGLFRRVDCPHTELIQKNIRNEWMIIQWTKRGLKKKRETAVGRHLEENVLKKYGKKKRKHPRVIGAAYLSTS
jgi:hypothetical protein